MGLGLDGIIVAIIECGTSCHVLPLSVYGREKWRDLGWIKRDRGRKKLMN